MAVLSSTDITTYKVANAIGVNSRDVGTLCLGGSNRGLNNKINIWSKWKPIKSAAKSLTIDELRIANYGLSYTDTKYNRPDQLVAGINSGTSVIKYNPPEGGINSPYRLGDFRNYDHLAYNPCGTGIPEDYTIQTIKKGTAGMTTVFSLMEQASTPYQIGLDDLKAMFGYATGTMYYCVILKLGNKYWWTSSSDFVTIQWDSNLSLKAATGTFEVYMCLCNKNFNNVIKEAVTYSDEEYYPITTDRDNINPYQIKLTNEDASTPSYSVTFDVYIEGGVGKYNVHARSVKGTNRFDRIMFNVYDKNPAILVGNTFGTCNVSNTSFSLTEGKIKTFTGTFEITGDYNRQWFFGGFATVVNSSGHLSDKMEESGVIVNYGDIPE